MSSSTDSMNPPLVGQIDDALLVEPSRRYRRTDSPLRDGRSWCPRQAGRVALCPAEPPKQGAQGGQSEADAALLSREPGLRSGNQGSEVALSDSPAVVG